MVVCEEMCVALGIIGSLLALCRVWQQERESTNEDMLSFLVIL